MSDTLIAAALLRHPSIAALVGERIALKQLDQGEALPALVYSIPSSNTTAYLAAGHDTGKGFMRLQVNPLAQTSGEVEAIHAAVHQARPDAACVMHLHNLTGIAVGMQEAGLLPLSPYALRFYGELAYHDYEGIAMTPDEQARVVHDLGSRPAMLLRNHGSLTVGRTVAEAFVLMETLDRACDVQLRAQAAGVPLRQPPQAMCETAHAQLVGDGSPEGVLEWPSLLRRLDAANPRYRT